MSIAQVTEIGRDMLYIALVVAMPALGITLIVGLVISILQTITSIQEQTLSIVPRLFAVGVVLALTMPFLVQVIVHFTMRMLYRAAEVGK